ncbi:hypothetical protein LX32DRAFT_164937 [Colletotrichum zoysiae]|uniref:Uncharacterized protein n=1 Tax=Colletotrichum zoysiae TaxID=1216348 RepID=A0AAD9H6G5_9PEZI|nr:hypothetical protein LX32DRAFT_164937 [Colletotrichum zoysiae]
MTRSRHLHFPAITCFLTQTASEQVNVLPSYSLATLSLSSGASVNAALTGFQAEANVFQLFEMPELVDMKSETPCLYLNTYTRGEGFLPFGRLPSEERPSPDYLQGA